MNHLRHLRPVTLRVTLPATAVLLLGLQVPVAASAAPAGVEEAVPHDSVALSLPLEVLGGLTFAGYLAQHEYRVLGPLGV